LIDTGKHERYFIFSSALLTKNIESNYKMKKLTLQFNADQFGNIERKTERPQHITRMIFTQVLFLLPVMLIVQLREHLGRCTGKTVPAI
jgi:hypothetical protein